MGQTRSRKGVPGRRSHKKFGVRKFQPFESEKNAENVWQFLGTTVALRGRGLLLRRRQNHHYHLLPEPFMGWEKKYSRSSVERRERELLEVSVTMSINKG